MAQVRSRTVFTLLTGLTALALAACADKTARESGAPPRSGFSLTSAAAIGTSVSAVVELSDMYRAPETYDVRITVLEILRGKPCMDFLKKAGASNAAVRNGFEYILARIRFEYAARGAPGDKTWELTGGQFNAYSGDGKPYEIPSIVPPEPKLNGVLRSGDFKEGWTAFAVAIEDKKPVMNFGPGSIWFQLY